MKLPPTIVGSTRDTLILSDGTAFMSARTMRSTEALRFPELVIENNVENIREAALTTLRCLILATDHMQLFSFDELYSEALNQLNERTKELEDGLLSELPNTAADGGLLDTETITLIGHTDSDDPFDETQWNG